MNKLLNIGVLKLKIDNKSIKKLRILLCKKEKNFCIIKLRYKFKDI